MKFWCKLFGHDIKWIRITKPEKGIYIEYCPRCGELLTEENRLEESWLELTVHVKNFHLDKRYEANS